MPFGLHTSIKKQNADAPLPQNHGCRPGQNSYHSSITDTAEWFIIDTAELRPYRVGRRREKGYRKGSRLTQRPCGVVAEGTGYSRTKPNSNRSRFIDLHVFSGTRQNLQPQRTPDGPRQTHRSCASVPTAPSRCTTRIPALTRPKIVCLLSRYGVGASVMKNCDPKKGSVTRTNYGQLQGTDR